MLRRFGIALGVLNPRQFQLRIFIGPGSPGCQDLPIKNAGMIHLPFLLFYLSPLFFAFFLTVIPYLLCSHGPAGVDFLVRFGLG
ncbi:hypothetical protein A2U01_0001957 [Trifolium medium]|uniref:Uncharacterized protein n=1 Tax=Trifolium medium TaxID=97028 RepID=A0A392M465_9FABA|nr:hypothetical protein [Trifolium medium]